MKTFLLYPVRSGIRKDLFCCHFCQQSRPQPHALQISSPQVPKTQHQMLHTRMTKCFSWGWKGSWKNPGHFELLHIWWFFDSKYFFSLRIQSWKWSQPWPLKGRFPPLIGPRDMGDMGGRVTTLMLSDLGNPWSLWFSWVCFVDLFVFADSSDSTKQYCTHLTLKSRWNHDPQEGWITQ